MNNNGLLSAISMAKGAGKLKAGFDASMDAVFSGASLVLLTKDASDRTAAEVQRFCNGRCPVILLDETQDTIASKLGKRIAVAAVTDPNFAALIKKNLTTEEEENA